MVPAVYTSKVIEGESRTSAKARIGAVLKNLYPSAIIQKVEKSMTEYGYPEWIVVYKVNMEDLV